MKSVFYLCIFIFFLSACDSGSDICLSNQQSVQGNFYSSYYNYTDDVDTFVAPISIVGLSDGVPVDSIIYQNDSIDNCYMPLSMFHDTTQYLIKVNNSSDTISFVHNKELSFISEECGFIFDFKLDTIMYSNTSFIDTVIIYDNEIIYNESTPNVKIYIY